MDGGGAIDLTFDDDVDDDGPGLSAAAAAAAAANGNNGNDGNDDSHNAAAADDAVAALEARLRGVEQEQQQVERQIAALHKRQQRLAAERDDLQRRIQVERRAPRVAWQSASFPWSQRLEAALHAFQGPGSSWRPLQREVCNATLQGRDVLLLLPAGGGKSLTYQLPAVVDATVGVTLVVSPLLALIHDQLLSLAEHAGGGGAGDGSGGDGAGPFRLDAAGLTSATTKEEAAATMARLTAFAGSSGGAAAPKAPLLLYATPEKVVNSKRLLAKLEKVYQAGRLVRIAVDECHCCSTWGNDFRPDYKKLGVLKQCFPHTPLLAVTATATARVASDVRSILRIDGCEQFAASVDRANLRYEALRKPPAAADAAGAVLRWIRENFPGCCCAGTAAGGGAAAAGGGGGGGGAGAPPQQRRQQQAACGIVYCLTRKECEALADALCAGGVAAAPYHADMDPDARAAAHDAWAHGGIAVIVATIAFGMGISRTDVRFVLHTAASKSIENYYQESGRAGRDGAPNARCVLMHRFSDVMRQAAIVCMEPTWAQNLCAVTRYAAAAPGQCRRAIIARHFGEEPPPRCRPGGLCDLCAAAAAAAAAAAPVLAAGSGGAGGQQPQPQPPPRPQDDDLTAVAAAVVAALRARKDRRATLAQLLDDAGRALKKQKAGPSGGAGPSNGGSSSSSAAAPTAALTMSRDELEWAVEAMYCGGLLGLDFGFTAYATTAYLVATAAGDAVAAGARRFAAARPLWLPAAAAAAAGGAGGAAGGGGAGAGATKAAPKRAKQKQQQQQQPPQPPPGKKQKKQALPEEEAEGGDDDDAGGWGDDGDEDDDDDDDFAVPAHAR